MALEQVNAYLKRLTAADELDILMLNKLAE